MQSTNTLHRDYSSYLISHDGEGDDIQALAIAHDALKGKKAHVDCVIGNPDIVHVSKEKKVELQARMALTNEVFGAHVAVAGAVTNDAISEDYVDAILQNPQEKECLVLHTDSFKSLQALFTRATKGQLKNVVIVTYGSVNLAWAMPKPEDYKPFYDSLAASGATLIQIEGFPFLGTKNKITHKNTPLTYSLLEHLDGPAGKKWTDLNASAQEAVREKQAGKIAEFIAQAMKKGDTDKVMTALLSQIAQLLDHSLDEAAFTDAKKLQQMLNRSLVGEQHDRLVALLSQLCTQLAQTLGIKEIDLKRPFNIFEATSLRGQALIADQIPAIVFSELVEKRAKGLARECQQVQFAGFNGKFAQYAVSTTQSSLYYLDTQKKADAASFIDSSLQYIDLCIATALLSNDAMIKSATRKQLLSSPFKKDLLHLSESVRKLGYDLPKSNF